MLMLLGVCISSIIAIAYVGYDNGRQALNNSIQNQLISVRETKAYQIENYFKKVRAEVQTYSQGEVNKAVKGFAQAFQELESAEIQLDWHEKLKKYYEQEFLPKLAANTAGRPLLYSYLPQNSAARYLQYHYIAGNTNPIGEKEYFNNANDGSQYSGIHKIVQPIYSNFITQLGYYDLFLIDAKTGNIVYSVKKETDFGTNLIKGPYSTSGLASVFRQAVNADDPNFVAISDFSPYRASYAEPSAFVASPIFDLNDSELIGVLAFQLSANEINSVMTGNNDWEEEGLGKSGETYLVGSDYGMRSNSRFLIQQPQKYFKAIAAKGLPKDKIAFIKKFNSSILHQEIATEAIKQALDNKAGFAIANDYRGIETLNAYRPLEIDDLNWAINAQIDTQEAFEPIKDFQRQVLLATTIIVLLVTLIASILSYYFIRPIRTLIDGFRQVGKGNTDVKITVKSKDEFRELANSFNEMVDNLDHQKKLVQEKNEENEELLLSILPEPVAERVKKGEESIGDSFSNITVLFADLGGFIELSESLPAVQTVSLLNDLVSAFDDAAEKHGVEKHKTIGSGYMAVCGLSVPRLDHAKRTIDFAKEMLRIVRRFNREKNTDLKLRIGVNSGSVVAGIVGKDKFIYDLWGDTVNVANRLQSRGEWNTIQVTENVHNRIAEFIEDFEPVENTEISDRENFPVWSTKPY
ncbi:HAMP domain-containing protein [Waterburya agarophytonicola K14]|uniref:HAMP domain-containing protein n=2 Tax=Waterburya TaxID=2886915 RepID=A0A964BN42_9CYAN|nr:HAMP domain-containing protein [Waterburya agarophytonicola KI4]